MRTLIILAVSLFAWLSAATIDVDFQHIAQTGLGRTLEQLLLAPVAEGGEADHPLATCDRALVVWNSPKQTPVVRFHGVDVADRIAKLMPHGGTVETKHGVGQKLAAYPGLVAIMLAPDEMLVGAPALIDALEAPPAWPAPTGNVMTFVGLSGDLNLDDLQDEIVDFVFTWAADGAIRLVANTHNKAEAKAVLRWISVRRPLLAAAAGLGIDKAQFPERMLDSTTFGRDGAAVTAKLDLNDQTRGEAVDYLTKNLSRKMRKYR
jgi:hypothetical protein